MDTPQEAAFLALRERFLQRLPERWQEIVSAANAEDAAAAMHRLAGAAGCFGFDALGQCAKLGEAAERGTDVAARLRQRQALHALLQQALGVDSLEPPSADTLL